MSILLQTQHTNINTTQRITRIVVGMAIIIGCTIGAINYSLLVDSTWFATAMWPAAYLLFSGFTGFAPFGNTTRQRKCKKPLPPIGPFIVYTH